MAKKSPKPAPAQEELNASNTEVAGPPFPECGTDTPTKPAEGKSIGDCLTEQAKPQDIADAQIGDRMVHETYGIGTVLSRNDITLWIKHDTQGPSEEPAMHGIEFSRKTLTFAPPVAAAGQQQKISVEQPAVVPEAAKPLTPEEIEVAYQKAVFDHMDKGQLLAADVRDLKQKQTDGQAALNEVHKELKEAQEAVVAHAENVPRRDQFAQKKIDFDGRAPDPSRMAGSTAPTPSQDSLGYNVPGDCILPLKDSGLSLRDLHNSLFPEFKPGKKAKDVGKMGVEIKGSGYLIREVSPDGTRFFAQLLVDTEMWDEMFAKDYGLPVANFDTSAEARQDRTKGGADCGRIVKVGKKTCVLAPESNGLVIVASKEEVERYISWQKAGSPVDGQKDAAAE